MPREIPGPPENLLGLTGDAIRTCSSAHDLELKLVTPMFGGGVVSREVDENMPVRATSIRGQLQFWWRATVGSKYSPEELFKAHEMVWGSTAKSSAVQIIVEDVRRSQQRFDLKGLDYVLFPFQENNQGQAATSAKIDKLKLKIIVNEELWVNHVRPAVWAWVNFGGLGSRTRRGCGSLFCEEFSPENENEFESQLNKYCPRPNEHREWPTLYHSILVHQTVLIQQKPGVPHSNPAWVHVVRLYKDFRQGEEVGRNRGQERQRPGRSRFPEAEAIREITHQRSRRHPIEDKPADFFPRAEFGLPIVFHFQGAGEPSDSTLYPNLGSNCSSERMSSPLIIKPLALKNKKYIPLILRLNTPVLHSVKLKHGNQENKSDRIRGEKLALYTNSPFKNRSAEGSALDAFMKFAQEQGFETIP